MFIRNVTIILGNSRYPYSWRKMKEKKKNGQGVKHTRVHGLVSRLRKQNNFSTITSSARRGNFN